MSSKIKHGFGNSVRNCIKNQLRNLTKSFENWPQNGPNFLENRVLEPSWSTLGASWRQDGPRVAPRVKINEKCLILGVPMGSKMEPKLVKNLIKFRVDFCNVFKYLFFRSWIDFGSKNLSKMRGLGVTFSTSLRICEKCDFERPSYGFARFFHFRRVDFRPEKIYFSNVFSKMLSRRIFFDFRSKLGPNSVPIGTPNRLKNQWKSKLIFWWNFDGFSVAQGGSNPLRGPQGISRPPLRYIHS